MHLHRIGWTAVVSALAVGSAPAQWSSPTDISARSGLAATTVAGKALFAGGLGNHPLNFCPTFHRDVDIWDAATGTWSTHFLDIDLTDMAATAVGHKALFAGGRESDCPYPAFVHGIVFVYDADTGAWTTTGLSAPRYSAAATTVGTQAVFAGGYSSFGSHDFVDLYDDATGVWSTARLSSGRWRLAAAAVGDLAFFAGGWHFSDPSDVVDVYDAGTGTWSTDRLPSAAGATAGTAVGGRALFSNGTTVDIYDTVAGTWSTFVLPRSRRGVAATTVGDLALIGGGVSYDGSLWVPDGTVDVYDAALDAWRSDVLPSVHGEGLAATAVNGRAIFAGGGWTDTEFHHASGAVDFYGPILGSSYCAAARNSTGLRGALVISGSGLASANRLALWASALPPDEPGYFLTSRTQGFVPHPGGSQGNLCLAGAIGRFVEEVRSSGAQGTLSILVDLTDMPAPAQQVALAGETWNFQCWFRDAADSNFTSAAGVTLE